MAPIVTLECTTGRGPRGSIKCPLGDKNFVGFDLSLHYSFVFSLSHTNVGSGVGILPWPSLPLVLGSLAICRQALRWI